jgi:hypothetical protein
VLLFHHHRFVVRSFFLSGTFAQVPNEWFWCTQLLVCGACVYTLLQTQQGGPPSALSSSPPPSFSSPSPSSPSLLWMDLTLALVVWCKMGVHHCYQKNLQREMRVRVRFDRTFVASPEKTRRCVEVWVCVCVWNA